MKDLLVAIELNGWRYEATQVPGTNAWVYTRTYVLKGVGCIHRPNASYPQPLDNTRPEQVLKELLVFALTECTLY
jgi:hypothetical protein